MSGSIFNAILLYMAERNSVVLVILDGWGIGLHDSTNPVFLANPPNLQFIRTHYKAATLQASGVVVGLPWGEEGNSEVGHLTIGAGKALYQHYPRISLAIQNGTFLKNPAFLAAAEHAKKNNSALHLVGLITESNIHAALDHLAALIEFTRNERVPRAYLHMFSDGRDSRARSMPMLLKRVEKLIKNSSVKIASIGGRYYALDRDGHWDRTEKMYDMLVGKGTASGDPLTWIEKNYADGLEDEFIEPSLLGEEPHPITDGDAMIFFDFREDSIRQLAGAFAAKEFEGFPRKEFKDLFVVTMTDYSSDFDAQVAFPPEHITAPLGKILADHGKTQIRIAETEKYAHVTYFFNGYRAEPFANEYHVLVPSKNAPSVDLVPEMMAHEVAARVIESIEGGGFDFILANFANADMVAHTGNLDAAITAINVIDEQIGRIKEAALKRGSTLLITADHGHVERMIDPMTGAKENRHSKSLVPFYVVGKAYETFKTEQQASSLEEVASGLLSDVAPTVLELLGLEKSKEMTGQSLLHFLR